MNRKMTAGTALFLCGATALFGGRRDIFEIEQDQEAFNQKQLYLQKLRSSSGLKSEDKPNIIFIVVDDLGKYDCSLYDEDSPIQTPHLKALADSGALFTEGLSSAPICSPSRAGILTGRQQQRFGFEYRLATIYPGGKAMKWFAERLIDLGQMHISDRTLYPNRRQMRKQGLPTSEIAVSELLRASGYRTSMIGKWDVGYDHGMVPESFGFHDSFDFLEAYTLFDDPRDPDIVNSRQDNFQNRFIWRQRRKGTCAIRRNGKRVREEEYLTFAFSREAIDRIDKSGNDPFFLYLSFNAPHTPFQAPLRYYNLFPEVEDHNKRVYYAMIRALDDAIGDIIDKLERSGKREQTLICFASDNGGAEYTLATDNGPLKGGKFSNFEGAINVPYIISWPGNFPAGQVVHEPVSTLDFFTTAAEAAGIESLPSDRKFDGINLLPMLQGKTAFNKERTLFWRAGYNRYMRKGEWKLILNGMSGQEELYNLKEDKFEQNNLKEVQPELFRALKLEYKAWDSAVKLPAWPHVMNYEYIINGEPYYFAL